MKDMRLVNAAFWKREEERYASFKWTPGYSGAHNHKCAQEGCQTLCRGIYCSRHRPPSSHSKTTPEARARHAAARKAKAIRAKATALSGHEVL